MPVATDSVDLARLIDSKFPSNGACAKKAKLPPKYLSLMRRGWHATQHVREALARALGVDESDIRAAIDATEWDAR